MNRNEEIETLVQDPLTEPRRDSAPGKNSLERPDGKARLAMRNCPWDPVSDHRRRSESLETGQGRDLFFDPPRSRADCHSEHRAVGLRHDHPGSAQEELGGVDDHAGSCAGSSHRGLECGNPACITIANYDSIQRKAMSKSSIWNSFAFAPERHPAFPGHRSRCLVAAIANSPVSRLDSASDLGRARQPLHASESAGLPARLRSS